MKVRAWAAEGPKQPLVPYEYVLGPIGDDEVDIRVEACGICHSDLSMLNNDWGISRYPLVPGHEVAGIVVAVGKHVRHIHVGQRVGLGWHRGYCQHCHDCLSGDWHLCADAQATIVGHHGGFAELVRAEAVAVCPLPDGIDPAHAGPLMCGGLTVFSPLLTEGVRPVDCIGVVGIGGLGHLAIQFANKWGCEVVAMTSSEAKTEMAVELGAHHVISSRDTSAWQKWRRKMRLILVTTNQPLDWLAMLDLLAPHGRLHFVGVVTAPLNIPPALLLDRQHCISGSPVGSPSTMRAMMQFAARHQIQPWVERFPMSKVNTALTHLADGKARFRVVLDADWRDAY